MVCIEKRPYTLYGRLATLHFRYLTCLLDRGHIISGRWLSTFLPHFQADQQYPPELFHQRKESALLHQCCVLP